MRPCFFMIVVFRCQIIIELTKSLFSAGCHHTLLCQNIIKVIKILQVSISEHHFVVAKGYILHKYCWLCSLRIIGALSILNYGGL
jgi:hypothetical protein